MGRSHPLFNARQIAHTTYSSGTRGIRPFMSKKCRFWSARICLRYRALAVESGEDLVWFWIGTHADYDKLVTDDESRF